VPGELLRTRSEVLAPATPLITIEDFQRPEEEEEEEEDGVSGQGTDGVLLGVDRPGVSAVMGERGSGAVLGADATDATDAVAGEARRGTSGNGENSNRLVNIDGVEGYASQPINDGSDGVGRELSGRGKSDDSGGASTGVGDRDPEAMQGDGGGDTELGEGTIGAEDGDEMIVIPINDGSKGCESDGTGSESQGEKKNEDAADDGGASGDDGDGESVGAGADGGDPSPTRRPKPKKKGKKKSRPKPKPKPKPDVASGPESELESDLPDQSSMIPNVFLELRDNRFVEVYDFTVEMVCFLFQYI
jgi:hypothetical protein